MLSDAFGPRRSPDGEDDERPIALGDAGVLCPLHEFRITTAATAAAAAPTDRFQSERRSRTTEILTLRRAMMRNEPEYARFSPFHARDAG